VRLVGYLKKKSITMHGNMNLKKYIISQHARNVFRVILLSFKHL